MKGDIIHAMVSPNPWITLSIVVLTLIGIAIGKFPVIKSNRTTIALMGVALLLLFGQVQFDELPGYVDFDTIFLLFSMVVINANLKLAGFFNLIGSSLTRLVKTPRSFLALEIVLVGVLSALFLNDTVCLMFTPFLLTLMDSLKRDPLPYLIGLATAANVGSAATLTGNPQNMIVGAASGISYLDFTLALAPVALLGLAVIWLVLLLLYPRELTRTPFPEPHGDADALVSVPLLRKSMIILVILLAAFLLGAPIALASFLAANLLLITRRHQPHLVFAEFDWGLLVFFSALFVVSGSLESSGVTHQLVDLEKIGRSINLLQLSGISVLLSNLISNVPAVLLLKPVVEQMAEPRTGWLALAVTSTLAGNLTLLGSVANLIVAETAARWRVDLSFWEYAKAGVIITILTLAIALVWLLFVL